MIISKDLKGLKFDRKSAVTIGTFDGFHLGHQQIIYELIVIKSISGCRTVVVTFDPHPQIVLRNKPQQNSETIKILSTTDEKLKLFEKAGIDIVCIISFDEQFALTPADIFFENFILKRIGLTDFVIGYDHLFGKNKEGSIETVKMLSEKNSFRVHKVHEYMLDSEIVSSTLIRKFIIAGEIEKANASLKRFYSVTGKVVHGEKRGKAMGYPTANIEVGDKHKLIPAAGIYAVRCEIRNEKHYGMMSVGTNPTFNDSNRQSLEVNIFDLNKDIYDEEITVEFIEYIRNEEKFDSVEELVKKIHTDKEKTLSIINKLHVN
ncbi:bifunctional riboflavin kinase/FAD synthetase [soil metagenome]